MTVTVSSPTLHQHFRCRRPIQIGGEQIPRGEIIDLMEYDLPPGRAEQLVAARIGEMITVDDLTVVRHRTAPPEQVEANDVQPPDGSGDEEGVTPLGKWTEVYLMGLGKAGQQDLCRQYGVAVRGTLSDRADRLLLHQQEN